jgi:hypothetical protein
MEIGYGKLAQSGAKPLQDFFDSIRLSCSPMSQGDSKLIQPDHVQFEQGPAFFKSGSYKHLLNFRASASSFQNSSGSIQSKLHIVQARLDIAYKFIIDVR